LLQRRQLRWDETAARSSDFPGPLEENPGPSGSPETQRPLSQPWWGRLRPRNRADRRRRLQEGNDVELEELLMADSLSLLQRAMLFIFSAIFGSLTEPPNEEAGQDVERQEVKQGPDRVQRNPDPPGRLSFRTRFTRSIFRRIRNAIQKFLFRIMEIPVFVPPPPWTPPRTFLIPPYEVVQIGRYVVERIAEPDGMSYTQRIIGDIGVTGEWKG